MQVDEKFSSTHDKIQSIFIYKNTENQYTINALA